MKAKLFTTLCVALAMLAVLVTVLPLGQATAATDNSAPQALKNVKQVLLYGGNGITSTKTGSAFYTGGYAAADCYSIVDATDTQTMTTVISHSADASNWVTWYSFSAVSADGAAFTTSVPYGQYLRASVFPQTTNAITVSVRCILKD